MAHAVKKGGKNLMDESLEKIGKQAAEKGLDVGAKKFPDDAIAQLL